LLLLGSATAAAAAQPDAFPNRAVRLIVSNTPGSAPDVVARLLAAKLIEAWGQQIVVDNRPGATGLIAAETVAKSAPDGYTLWLNTMTQLISTLQAQRHMLAKDFAPVSLVASTPFVIVINASLPA
jgi:tripartite-type tricarboxylate transporter receptor subunit TctC